ncbi:hypothetical protein LEP1GSC047_2559 [Leptospira inadai serovar Lyme str. 10]|uniref:Uncharacterized protein n=1 Tax=Leptospira inadai serovar Lyme str. 10 TaxID=1049790 RepID=V6HCD3_9LEPT|nr:hypothetical protein LEP1GSC047_2559 [Leptospira inadai serovar Lyme str. 10]
MEKSRTTKLLLRQEVFQNGISGSSHRSLSLGFILSYLGWILCDIILLYSHYNLTLEDFFPTVNLFIGPVPLE